MKKRLLAWILALVMLAALLPTAVLAEDAPLAGFCGGDANAEKIETITGNTWVNGKKIAFSTDIYDNVRWQLAENGNSTYTLTLSGSGEMADYLAGSVRPWNNYAAKITKLVVENGVSSVGSRTCYNFATLTDVVLAATVTDIGEYSFSSCNALTSIDLSNVTSIRANAMRDDTALSDITLSSKLNVIGYQAFCNSGAPDSSISIPESVTEIGFGAFSGAKFTNVLNLPNVKKVGARAFNMSKFAAVVLTNANLEIIAGIEDTSGGEIKNGVFSAIEAVFYTSVPGVMDSLYDENRMNNKGIIACTNGGSFASGTEFNGFTLAVPQKDGYIFAGWYSNQELTEKEGLSEENGTYVGTPTTEISADGRRYYARWKKSADNIPGKDEGKQMAVDLGSAVYGETPSATVLFEGSDELKEVKSDHDYFDAVINDMNVTITPKAGLQPGTYTDTLYVHTETGAVHFITVTLTVTPKPEEPQQEADAALSGVLAAITGTNPFSDVPGGAYYNAAVRWAVKNGIASGTDAKHFSPDAACTRAQAVTFLYRAAGSPAGYANSGYTDVPETSYCAAPVAWAVALRITSGTGTLTFSPDDLCTRAQIVTFLYRANA